MSGAAVVAVQEERARIGNIQVTKETAFVATEEGALPPPQPALPITYVQRPPEYSWYDPRGKDCCVALLLILMWIVIAVITLPLFILCFICYCCCGSDDNE